jgi:hypothetical protein
MLGLASSEVTGNLALAMRRYIGNHTGRNREHPIKDRSFFLTPFGNSEGTQFLTIQSHTWQTAKPATNEFVLVACVMSPAFTPEDWELA